MFDFAIIRRRLFRISPSETRFSRRGFPDTEPTVQRHLETAGGAFVEGYNLALDFPRIEHLIVRLNDMDAMYRGFSFEGAAMALALLDLITPWNRSRLRALLETSDGDAHLYMLYIGAGWAIARIPWARRRFEHAMARYHPLFGWLALDGYGFHQGFFHTRAFVVEQTTPPRLSTHAARVFDQGLGRSLWFSQGADVERIIAVITAFPANRRADLWSGTGLAASYAGGVSRSDLELLRDRAMVHASQLAQGAAFAAKARQRAGNPATHTEMACDVFCQMPADDAAAITDSCLRNLPDDDLQPAYQTWRMRISASFSLAEQATQVTMESMPTARL